MEGGSGCPFVAAKALAEDELLTTPLRLLLIEYHHFSPLFT